MVIDSVSPSMKYSILVATMGALPSNPFSQAMNTEEFVMVPAVRLVTGSGGTV